MQSREPASFHYTRTYVSTTMCCRADNTCHTSAAWFALRAGAKICRVHARRGSLDLTGLVVALPRFRARCKYRARLETFTRAPLPWKIHRSFYWNGKTETRGNPWISESFAGVSEREREWKGYKTKCTRTSKRWNAIVTHSSHRVSSLC